MNNSALHTIVMGICHTPTAPQAYTYTCVREGERGSDSKQKKKTELINEEKLKHMKLEQDGRWGEEGQQEKKESKVERIWLKSYTCASPGWVKAGGQVKSNTCLAFYGMQLFSYHHSLTSASCTMSGSEHV